MFQLFTDVFSALPLAAVVDAPAPAGQPLGCPLQTQITYKRVRVGGGLSEYKSKGDLKT